MNLESILKRFHDLRNVVSSMFLLTRVVPRIIRMVIRLVGMVTKMVRMDSSMVRMVRTTTLKTETS